MLKVAVMGGGSTYTPELINGFLARIESFPIDELWLMDISKDRLNIVGGFAQRMVEAKGKPFKVVLTTDQQAAIQDANYVTTQLRVGMMPARRNDEYLGRRHGLVGQETTGVGGMAKALRTIPVILQIAKDMETLAPGALLVNFTNPSGLVTEALFRYAPKIRAVGVCNSAIGLKMSLLKEIEQETGQTITPERAQIKTLGLNHLTWYHGFTVDGEELWPRIIEKYVKKLRSSSEPEWDPDMIETLGMIPNSYLQYFYYTQNKIVNQEKWPPSRAEQVQMIEDELLKQYAEPGRSEPPPGLMKRGGAYYSTVATQLLNAHYNDLNEIHVANVRQDGAVEGWPTDWVLELACLVDKHGIHPMPIQPLPDTCYKLIAQVKEYELLTVEAAVHGDRNKALQALVTNPLGPDPDHAQAVLDDMLETNRPYLPQFTFN